MAEIVIAQRVLDESRRTGGGGPAEGYKTARKEDMRLPAVAERRHHRTMERSLRLTLFEDGAVHHMNRNLLF